MRPLFPRAAVFLVLAPTEADHRWAQTPRLHALEHHPDHYTSPWALTLCLLRLRPTEITSLTEHTDPETRSGPEMCAQCCSTIATGGFRGRVIPHAMAE